MIIHREIPNALTMRVGNSKVHCKCYVSEFNTPREVFDFCGIDHSIGKNSLNGVELNAGDLDKPLRQLDCGGFGGWLINDDTH